MKVAIHPAARRWFTHQSFLLCRGKSPPDTLPLVPSNCQRRQDVQCYLGNESDFINRTSNIGNTLLQYFSVQSALAQNGHAQT